MIEQDVFDEEPSISLEELEQRAWPPYQDTESASVVRHDFRISNDQETRGKIEQLRSAFIEQLDALDEPKEIERRVFRLELQHLEDEQAQQIINAIVRRWAR